MSQKYLTMKSKFILLFLIVLHFFLRWPFQTQFLYEFDSVNYALAIEGLDIIQHAPHPPGYVFHILIAKALFFIIGDGPRTLIILSMLYEAGTLILLYMISKAWGGRWLAFGALTGIMFNPVFWLHGEVSMVYPAEAFGATLVAWRASELYHRPTRLNFLLTTGCLAFVGGLRQYLIFFLLPLVLWSAIPYLRQRINSIQSLLKEITMGFITFTPIALSWLLILLWASGGITPYLSELKDMYRVSVYIVSPTSFFHALSSGDWSLFLPRSKEFLMMTFEESAPVFFIAILWGIKKVTTHESVPFSGRQYPKYIFILLWIIPAFTLYFLVKQERAGYTMTYLPAIALLMGVFSEKVMFKVQGIRKGIFLTILIILLIGLQTSYFLRDKVHMSYQDRMTGFALTSLQSLMENPSRTLIIYVDHWGVGARDIPPSEDGAVPLDWRKIMYYFPGTPVIGIDPIRWRWAINHRRITRENIQGGKVPLIKIPYSNFSRIIWLIPPRHPEFETISNQAKWSRIDRYFEGTKFTFFVSDLILNKDEHDFGFFRLVIL